MGPREKGRLRPTSYSTHSRADIVMLPMPSMDPLTALGVANNQEDGDGNHGRIEDTRGAAGLV